MTTNKTKIRTNAKKDIEAKKKHTKTWLAFQEAIKNPGIIVVDKKAVMK
jgi:O-acetylhomoserine/O-acetylserine sulfhydrylase-like pyridoxal-dependent enzyme